MALGYDGKLYILAFDHRGSFQKKMFGIEGDPTPEETERIADAKHLIFEGMVKATETGAVQDDQSACSSTSSSAARIPAEAKEHGLKLAMPVEKSGQNEFDFEYGDEFGEHIEKFDPDFSKVLVRYNPDDAAELNQRQLGRLKRLADWLHEHDRKFLFELLVPATDEQLASVDGDTDRYDAELRPELMRRAIAETQDFGCEVDIWKIEGVDAREDAEMLARQTRVGEGREGVVCVLLGRGASDDKVDQWLRAAAPVEGFVGFAIGRSIWWDALKGFLDGSLEREAAAAQIAENYLRFIRVYEEQETAVASSLRRSSAWRRWRCAAAVAARAVSPRRRSGGATQSAHRGGAVGTRAACANVWLAHKRHTLRNTFIDARRGGRFDSRYAGARAPTLGWRWSRRRCRYRRVPRDLERADALRRPVGGEGVADDPAVRHRAPEAAVVGLAAVVAHAEHVARRNGDRARQVAPLSAGARGDERLALQLPVAHDVPVAHGDAIAAHADDALDEGLRGLLGGRAGQGWPSAAGAAARRALVGTRRRVEGDDVADLGVGARGDG